MHSNKRKPITNRYRLLKQTNRTVLHLIAIILALTAFVPFLISISASLTSETALAKEGYKLWPSEVSYAAYNLLLKAPEELVRSYGVTIFVTVLGTLLSMAVMVPFAYAMSRKDYSLRKFWAFYVFFTMVFSGGLVPWYILIKNYLHLGNSIWVMILPFLVNGWMIIILRANFASMPQEILDAAKIDGAGEWRILLQLAVPMTSTTIAALCIFLALGFWNTYYPALLFIDDRKLYPLQYFLYIIQTNVDIYRTNPNITGISIPVISLRYALVVLVGVPVMLFALFFQRYFVKGVYLGGMKE
jgi:putative aldouronate transport system permease protein